MKRPVGDRLAGLESVEETDKRPCSVVHSWFIGQLLSTTLSIDHNNRRGQQRPVVSLSAVVECCQL